ncbi:maleylpyruvate isomerase family mycothiol-dependent enzyme [Streptomyces sp. R302]|uniref:maleylpyruvate isomerase family mycothiol-dependent enzyme n=1 Tax=unclassified Streptomyces TaxID=2593676 RepID=UPI00145DC8BB|nr:MULTISPECIES: maleylpyruvate isomerase family mycothiol-dependent enzyme [unclassified Streptomyces]NML51004.1 maleylpyruvate isomerase family mycothiol-dependent enzyme [Streptomyces sp. R301]NML81098.1 maleylpyruvate isomerase family mycothiol-dependent enzyme [Streptomyces sp. R302]
MTESQRPDLSYGHAYGGVRDDIVRLLRDRPEAAGLPVPACPDWTVRDLVGHLLQVCRRVVAEDPRDLPDVPPPPKAVPIDELLARWTDMDEAMTETLARAPGLRPRIALMDIVSHHCDIRRALGVPATGDQPGLPDSLELVAMGFGLSVAEHKLPALRIATPGGTWSVGTGEAAATVRGGSLDVFRSLTGRRTFAQVSELSWSAPPETWWPAFAWGPFVPPEHPTEFVARV